MYNKKIKKKDPEIQILEEIVPIDQLPKRYRNMETFKALNLAFRFSKISGIKSCEKCKYNNNCPKQNDKLCFSHTIERLLVTTDQLDEEKVTQLDKQYTYNANHLEFTDKLFTVAVLFYSIISVFLDLLLGRDCGFWVIVIIFFISTIAMHFSFNDKEKDYTSFGKTFIHGLESYGNSLGLIGAIVALLLEFLRISRDNTSIQKWGVYFIVTAVACFIYIFVVPFGRSRNTKDSQQTLDSVLKSMNIKRSHKKKRK